MASKAFPAIIGAAAIGGLSVAIAGQDQPQPTFRSSIDLVRVDVNVLDGSGRPVKGLTAADFVVNVEGAPRRVVTAEYIPSGESGPKAAVADTPRHYSTNENAAGGRLIMLVVDQGTIGAGRGRQTAMAAERFISRLPASDRVGLMTIPGSHQIDFTSRHENVRAMLRQIVGSAPTHVGLRQVAVSEALAMSRGDQRVSDAVISRECAGLANDFERRMCRQEVMTHAAMTRAEIQDRAQNAVVVLRTLLERFAETPEPKTVIFISGGLVVDQDYSVFQWFGRLAARGHVTLYSVMIPPADFEASLQRLPVAYREDLLLAEQGLGHISGLGRGTMFRLATDPAQIFNRLELELSGYYMLGFEAQPADRADKARRIKVDVPGRGGVDVRARPEFDVDTPATKTVDAILGDTLRAPLLVTEIRLKVATYTIGDPRTQKLRVIVGTEIDRPRESAGRLALAFGLYDANGKLVASHIEREVATRVNPRTGAHQYFSGAMTNGPGTYTLKLAVTDDLRRRGSVEHTFTAVLTPAGQVRISDLLLAEHTGAGNAEDTEPVVSADYTSPVLHTALALYGDAAGVLDGASVTFEVSEAGESRALASAPGMPTGSANPVARTVQASLPIDVLPPGDYVARAIVALAGRKAGEVTRPFRIARPSVIAEATRSTTLFPGLLATQLERFDRKAVLGSDVVGYFLDRLTKNGAASGSPAVTEARGGRFDAVIEALKSSGDDELSSAFLAGLALYANGELDSAMRRFRDALRVDSEFFPAAFYLGACYAAGGRDREAANAWQTSLVTESDASFIYPLIGDALLRARDPKTAATILAEAAQRWPADEQLQLRLGIAYAAAGKPADAVRALDVYLAGHPADQERLFIALRAIYEARNKGTSIETPEKDRERFERYAAAYAAAGGPQQVLVARWKRFLDGK